MRKRSSKSKRAQEEGKVAIERVHLRCCCTYTLRNHGSSSSFCPGSSSHRHSKPAAKRSPRARTMTSVSLALATALR